jgi:hypothetical protein
MSTTATNAPSLQPPKISPKIRSILQEYHRKFRGVRLKSLSPYPFVELKQCRGALLFRATV